MVNSSNIDRAFNTHSYTLWRDIVERDDGTFIINDITISMGKHGAMNTNLPVDHGENHAVSESILQLNDIAEHNIVEMSRAMEEGVKWEMRMKESPLGKTQQDFVAYYTEVIALFTKWCVVHGVPLPQSRS